MKVMGGGRQQGGLGIKYKRKNGRRGLSSDEGCGKRETTVG